MLRVVGALIGKSRSALLTCKSSLLNTVWRFGVFNAGINTWRSTQSPTIVFAARDAVLLGNVSIKSMFMFASIAATAPRRQGRIEQSTDVGLVRSKNGMKIILAEGGKRLVSFVASLFGKRTRERAAALPNVRLCSSRVLGVKKLSALLPVFNLEVEGIPEFFANGVLTHNCKFKNAQETWDNLQFGMREASADRPRVLVTTTPRPIPVLRMIMGLKSTTIVSGSSYENRSNLDPRWFNETLARYEGTRLGRQEIAGEVIDDLPGALWTHAMLDAARVREVPEMQRVVIGVDPSGTSGDSEGANSVGIIAAGLGVDGLGYVLGDYTCDLSPSGWGRRVIEAYSAHSGDRVVAERNFGGAMVEFVIRAADPNVPVKLVTASRGKVVRAEPIASLYEQCVSGDSLIACERGSVPICDVRAGDRVWTRAGLRSVLWAGQTGVKQTMSIESGGNRLNLTEEHPVATHDGWVYARCLAHKEHKVLTWIKGAKFVEQPLAAVQGVSFAAPVGQKSVGKIIHAKASDLLSFLKVFGILSKMMGTGELPGMGVESFCTELYGRSAIESAFLKDGTSTILMKTLVTTISRILYSCLQESTQSIITQMDRGLLKRIRCVLDVAHTFLQDGHVKFCAPRSAEESSTSILSAAAEPVYNLHVDGVHEYVANGILVHNCRVKHAVSCPELEDQMCCMISTGFEGEGSPDRVDALVWAFTELMLPKYNASFSEMGLPVVRTQ